MRIAWTVSIIALLSMSLLAPHPAAADAVSACGEAQAKVSAKFVKSILLEATRACASGSAQNPAPLDVVKLQAALDKAIAGIDAAIGKFGSPNCYDNPISTDINSIITVAQDFADRLCRVP